ncbi:uncharacterized protein [Epargyreus clarus]|uniref:uncharacterized protein n=1 Tax=Epargyreus clarus TaxID=520877 RepID=UPI003C2F07D7
MIPFIIILHIIFVTITANMRCSNESPALIPKYYLIEKCHRSKLGVVARANYTSLSSCRRLAIEKKALAFNFSPPEVVNVTDRLEYTCEVLKCAEVSGGLSLANDTRFDYYSIYARPPPHLNASCVPATGMFQLIKKRLNYTQAETECRNVSGVLADISTEQRTDTLAQFVASTKLEAVFVGMRRCNTSKYYNTNGDSLECSTYRAWAPGHPRKSYQHYDCAVITPHRTWRSISCKKSLPTLCELFPGGPYKIGSIFRREEKDKSDNVTSIVNNKY